MQLRANNNDKKEKKVSFHRSILKNNLLEIEKLYLNKKNKEEKLYEEKENIK